MKKPPLSQNFLYDPAILNKIVDASGIGEEDTVVEIGPGPGTLTRVLVEKAGRVVAIEVDRRLYEALMAEYAGTPNLTLVRGDAMRYDYSQVGPFSVVANIPYHITTPLIFRLLEFKSALSSMTLTVQKEVAERIVAGPGSKDYGVLSISVQYHTVPRIKFTIPRGAFRPRPRVDSACLRMDVRDRPPVDVSDEEMFFRTVKTAFSQRRKTLHNSLKKLSPEADAALNDADIDPMRRPETLSIGEFARLSDKLAAS